MRLLLSAGSDFEAEIVAARLREAGVQFVRQGERIEGREGPYSRDIYVEEQQLERAQQVLAEAQDVSEEELIRLSEQPAAADEPERG